MDTFDKTNTVEIKLAGENGSPLRVRLKEIAALVEAVEEMITSLVVVDYPEVDRESLVVDSVAVKDGSISLGFQPAIEKIAHQIEQKDLLILPGDTLKQLDRLAAFTRQHRGRVEISTRKAKIAIAPEIEIPETPKINGETTLYGEIIEVGGETPTLQFRVLNGQVISCIVSKEMARKLGKRLYEGVGIRGLAHWDTQTLKVESFEVYELTDYEEINLVDAFAEVREAVGDAFDHIDDVNAFVSEIRGGSEAEV